MAPIIQNYILLTKLLETKTSLMVENGCIKKATFGHRVVSYFSGKKRSETAEKIQQIVSQSLQTLTDDSQKEAYCFASTYIHSHLKDKKLIKVMKAFDRYVGQVVPDHVYLENTNRSHEKKWETYSLDPTIYREFPDFADFLASSRILSQIKVADDEQIKKDLVVKDGEPHLRVDGQLLPWSFLKGRFEIQTHKQYPGPLLYCGKSDIQNGLRPGVYYYLPNGKGLQKHHPFKLTKKMKPIYRLSDEQLDRVRGESRKFTNWSSAEKAQEIKEAVEKGEDYVIQIASSTFSGSDTNYHNLLKNPYHPWIRLICAKDNPKYGTKKGDVLDVGFVAASKWPLFPLSTFNGHFKSPDNYNYIPSKDRVVTNIPATQKDVQKLYEFVMKYHTESEELGYKIGFHFGAQNCTAFVEAALKVVGVEINTALTLPYLIAEVSPSWIQTIGRCFLTVGNGVQKRLSAAVGVLPKGIRTLISYGASKVTQLVKNIFQVVLALTFTPLRFILGDYFGKKGQRFQKGDSNDKEIEPPLKNPYNIFDINSYKYHLPGTLQKWMREQASTVVFQNPIKMTVVPN